MGGLQVFNCIFPLYGLVKGKFIIIELEAKIAGIKEYQDNILAMYTQFNIYSSIIQKENKFLQPVSSKICPCSAVVIWEFGRFNWFVI
jgi:hypothetical protein